MKQPRCTGDRYLGIPDLAVFPRLEPPLRPGEVVLVRRHPGDKKPRPMVLVLRDLGIAGDWVCPQWRVRPLRKADR